MSGPRVFVTRPLPSGGTDPLTAVDAPGPVCEVVQRPDDEPLDKEGLIAALQGGFDGVVAVLTERFDADVFAAGEGRLRVVANVAVGYDNIDLGAATAAGVVVCNTPGILDDTTADIAFLLILAASRRTSEAEAALRQGRWSGFHMAEFLGRDVHGATLGLVGYGRIGRAVARRAEGFGIEVLHHTRTPTGRPGWTADLHQLLGRSDIVSLHVPLSPQSRHLIGQAELAAMKPTAVLVNTARGPVVDEEALAEALEQGAIYAAGIDVYEREPQVHPRLLAAPHTVLLPHIGSATVATRTAMARLAASSARAVLGGQMPGNVLNPVAAGSHLSRD
ncbi:MAG TPA: D-glycerate dehydrogenase [Acidimicrobiia bacterium]|nr:D-glycerate dehydrogenase [Acidimicrobiia bacterium]